MVVSMYAVDENPVGVSNAVENDRLFGVKTIDDDDGDAVDWCVGTGSEHFRSVLIQSNEKKKKTLKIYFKICNEIWVKVISFSLWFSLVCLSAPDAQSTACTTKQMYLKLQQNKKKT